MKALVTGATGFIGNYLVKELRRCKWQIFCLTRHPVTSIDNQISTLQVDLADIDSLRLLPKKVGKIDAIFHLGAMMPGGDSSTEAISYFVTNALSTLELLYVSLELDVNTFVYASSIAIVGRPQWLPITEEHPLFFTHPYLLSKCVGEQACEMFRRIKGLRVISLRISSPYGVGMSAATVLPKFVEKSLRSEDIEVYGAGNRSQNFVHVQDIVRACLLAVESGNSGVYNIGGPSAISMKQLAEMIVRLTPACKSQIILNRKPDPQDSYLWEVDLSHAKKELKYFPQITLEKGLAEYILSKRSGREFQRWYKP